MFDQPRSISLWLAWVLLVPACKDDAPAAGESTETSTTGDGDGDPGDGDGDPGDGDGDGDGDGGELTGELFCQLGSEPVGDWMRHTVAEDLFGAAYLSVADFDGDGAQDLVSSAFGTLVFELPRITVSPGQVHVHLQRGALDCWERVEIVSAADEIYFPNETTIVDLDSDGDLDVLLAAGFFVCTFDPNVGACGGIYLLENKGDHFERRDLVDEDTYFYHHAEVVDFDSDGDLDFVTGRESNINGSLIWYAGDGAGWFEPNPRVIDAEIGGTLPVVEDIDDDGDLDVASARYFDVTPEAPGFVWWERTAEPSDVEPAGVFTRHVISAEHGPGIKLELTRDLYGDDTLRAVATNHVNQGNDPPDAYESAVIVFEPGGDPTMPWTSTIISQGILSSPDLGLALQDAPGVFELGDADNDGDLDVLLSGDGDPRTFWIELDGPMMSTTHVIEPMLGQAGGGHAIDLDADGDTDPVFTGYEDNVVYVYETQ